jgi:hypothetical protein
LKVKSLYLNFTIFFFFFFVEESVLMIASLSKLELHSFAQTPKLEALMVLLTPSKPLDATD